MQISKRILSTLFLVMMTASVGFAQKAERAREVRQMIWNKKGEQYQNITIPDKWKNESAVILFQDYSHFYDGKGKKIEAENAYHLRIALLDKAAVKEYSEFSFNEKFYGRTGRNRAYRGVTYTGFKVIKSDGKEEIINLGESVTIESENGVDKKKIAITNLQVGDIIDYYYFEEERLILPTPLNIFSPVVSTIATNYPIVYLKKQFTVEKNFFISYKAVNGAPDLEEEVQDKLRIFKLEARDIEKVEATEWMYAKRSLPTVKFQVIYAKNGKESGLPHFIGQSGAIKNKVTENDISKFGGKLIGQTFVFDQPYFESKLKKKGMNASQMSDAALAKEIYFYLYNKFVGQHLENYYLGNRAYPSIDDYTWIGMMEAAFIKNNIESKLLIVPNRKYSDHEDLLFLEELNYLIKLEGDNLVYFTNFYLHPVFDQIPADAQNVDAFEITLTDMDRSRFLTIMPEVDLVKIPAEPITKNNVNVLSDITINEDMTELAFDNTYMVTGLSRDYYQYKFLTLKEYIYDEYKLNHNFSLKTRLNNKKEKIAVGKNLDELHKRQKKERLEEVENVLTNDYGVDEVTIDTFVVSSIGRKSNPLFAYDIKFSTEGLIKQAGPNYLLNAGMLVTTQRDIDEKDRKERKVDIYASNPRSYDTAITIVIPEGYSVQGIEKLNMDVQNETGGLVTTANIIEDKLYITYKKWYANNFEPKENWEKILAFLDAALAFNEVKVLLKKG